MVKITIETEELTLCKTIIDAGRVEEYNVVKAILDLVDAYDAAHNYKEYSIRTNLYNALIGFET